MGTNTVGTSVSTTATGGLTAQATVSDPLTTTIIATEEPPGSTNNAIAVFATSQVPVLTQNVLATVLAGTLTQSQAQTSGNLNASTVACRVAPRLRLSTQAARLTAAVVLTQPDHRPCTPVPSARE